MRKNLPFRAFAQRVVFGLLCAVGSALGAIQVTPEMALRAVKNWRATRDALSCRLGLSPRAARACQAAKAKFNVVQLEGGGFVVTSADTAIRPIVFFSDGDDLDEDPRNPLMGLLEKDLTVCAAAARDGRARLNSVAAPGVTGGVPSTAVPSENEQAWAELLDETPRATLQGKSSLSDVRAGPFVASTWNQSTVSTKRVYNYYTPGNYVCGCVATATAQVMRFFQWPRSDVAIKSLYNSQCLVDGKPSPQIMIGGYYVWSEMPLNPTFSSLTASQQQAIGKLCYDVGVGVSMDWTSDSSGANTFAAAWALTSVFKYTSAVAAIWSSDNNKTSSSEWTKRVLLTNFDMGLPVLLGITKQSGAGGHCIVGNGYGYSGTTLYYHLNYGWEDTYKNAWYAPPDLGSGYTIIDEIVYNIYTNQPANKVIVSGRLLGTGGQAAVGVTVTATKGGDTLPQTSGKTNSKGIFAVYVDPSSIYTIRAESGGAVASATAQTKSIQSVKCWIVDKCPKNGYYIGNADVEPCNVHVGNIQLVNQTLPRTNADTATCILLR